MNRLEWIYWFVAEGFLDLNSSAFLSAEVSLQKDRFAGKIWFVFIVRVDLMAFVQPIHEIHGRISLITLITRRDL
jgi:hypothetical protein